MWRAPPCVGRGRRIIGLGKPTLAVAANQKPLDALCRYKIVGQGQNYILRRELTSKHFFPLRLRRSCWIFWVSKYVGLISKDRGWTGNLRCCFHRQRSRDDPPAICYITRDHWTIQNDLPMTTADFSQLCCITLNYHRVCSQDLTRLPISPIRDHPLKCGFSCPRRRFTIGETKQQHFCH